MTKPSEIIVDKAMRLIARGLAAKRVKTVASGLENIPAHGPALIVARHYHHLYDGLALFAAISRPFHIVVTMDWVQNKPMKIFMKSMNRLARWPMLLRSDALLRSADPQRCLFSAHDVARYQRQAMRQSVDLLTGGRLLVVFPEGYPNIDPAYTPKSKPDEFLPFKAGFVNIVRAAERRTEGSVPMIPSGLRYDGEKPCVAHIVFGNPIYQNNFATKREIVAFVERKVRCLSGNSAC